MILRRLSLNLVLFQLKNYINDIDKAKRKKLLKKWII
jgi:hypothetical protein